MKQFIIILEMPDNRVLKDVLDALDEGFFGTGATILEISERQTDTDTAERAAEKRNADRIDGYDRDDLGPSPDF